MKEKMHQQLMARINKVGLAQKDVINASNGILRSAEVSRWFRGKISKAAILYLQLLCEKVENGYEIPSPERKERSDKGAPRVVHGGPKVYYSDKLNHSDEFRKTGILTPGPDAFIGNVKKIYEVDEVFTVGSAKMGNTRIAKRASDGKYMMGYDPYEKDAADGFFKGVEEKFKTIHPIHVQRDVENILDMKYRVKGKDMSVGDGDDIYRCARSEWDGATYIEMNGVKYGKDQFSEI